MNRSSYKYAQIDNETKIVFSVALLSTIIKPDHAGYDVLIPIREYDQLLLGMRYVGRDADGYGLFEAVPEPEQTEQEQNRKILQSKGA